MVPDASPFPGGIRHVAAVCDASPLGRDAAWRAALVASTAGLPMRLLFQAAPAQDGPGATPTDRLQRRIMEHFGIAPELAVLEGDPVVDAVKHSREGLLVFPSSRGNPIRDRVMGTPAERLIRLARGPVLVVKKPADAPYRKVMVAADLGPRSAALLDAAHTLSRRATVTLLHAVEPADELAMREFEAPPSVIREHRLRRAARARTALEMLATAREEPALHADAGADVRPMVVFGPPAPLIASSSIAARAEVVVVGKRRRGLLADFFLGDTTQHVLAAVEADVLVVPVQPAGAAARRVGMGQPSRPWAR